MENDEDSSRPLSTAIKISTATTVTMFRHVNHQASMNDEVLYFLEIPYPILLSLLSTGQYLDMLNKLMPEILLPLKNA